jgi:hypothetical protein
MVEDTTMGNVTQAKRRRRRRGTKRTPEIDLGTPEARAHKVALVGPADPALAEYPLGVLLARGILTPEQHDAGCHYAYLAGRVLGRTKPYRADLGGGGGEELGEGALAAVERRWHEAVRALLDAGRRAKDAVDNVAIFERLPGWLVRSQPRLGDDRERLALVHGLEALAAWRRGRARPVLAQAAE